MATFTTGGGIPQAPTTPQLPTMGAPSSLGGTGGAPSLYDLSRYGYDPSAGRNRTQQMASYRSAISKYEAANRRPTSSGTGGIFTGGAGSGGTTLGATSPFSPAPTVGGATFLPSTGGTTSFTGGSMVPISSTGNQQLMSLSGLLPTNQYGGMTGGINTGSGPVQNPYSLASQNAAINAGQVSGGQAAANIGAADMLRGTGAMGMQAGAQMLNTAFDPQNELRAREEQRLRDQMRVNAASRGITSSPYGAGLENQAMSDFSIDWQDRMLGRQAQGIQGFASGAGAGREAATTAGNIGQMGVGQVQQMGQLPYGAWNEQQQSDINNWISYMNMANAATNNAMQNYPNQLAQQSMQNYGGVPYISGGNTLKLST